MKCLHLGCGGEDLPSWLSQYEEVKLDANPGCRPHILASATDLGDIGPFEAVYTSHMLEHIVPALVVTAVREMHRVLTDDGIAYIIVPDLEDVRPTLEPIMEIDGRQYCGLDLIYGDHRQTANNPLMRHCSGFVADTLGEVMRLAGFPAVSVTRANGYQLIGIGANDKATMQGCHLLSDD